MKVFFISVIFFSINKVADSAQIRVSAEGVAHLMKEPGETVRESRPRLSFLAVDARGCLLSRRPVVVVVAGDLQRLGPFR